MPPTRCTAAILLVAVAALPLRAADPADARALRGSLAPEAADALGGSGAKVFRGAPEWNAFLDHLVALGWKKPADHAVVKTDFSREMVACIFQCSDDWNKFVVRKAASDGKKGELEIGLSFPIQKSGVEHNQEWHFIAVAVPKAPAFKASILVFHPDTGSENASIETALLTWSESFDETAGDVVDGLRGDIKPASATVKAGEDILVDFTLRFADPCAGKDACFARSATSTRVWDGKFSNGYRNHAFLVTTPDGKTHLLRRAVQLDWDKNAPHLVEVTHEKPYTLPEWGEGKTGKSLKALGLDTTAPGIYRITGVYTETAESSVAAAKVELQDWRGELFTNTVTVEVQ